MARKRKAEPEKKAPIPENVLGLRGEVTEEPIVHTLEWNYMPYAMSVIISRAIPEIDGFKPSHRKLLYTMYQMHLLTGPRTKSANVVGATMKLNPHGDQAIYDTMVRLSRGYGALLHPFVDSKGNFGKVYSRDMACAASRYTEVRLEKISAELFRDIDKDTVDFVPNYDGTLQEPTLLPTTFPNILVSANQGIAVGMASNLCGFNLAEVCDTTIAYMRNPDHDLLSTLKAPDFPTGGQLLYEPDALQKIYETGRGSVRLRARWHYVKAENLIEITEIPYNATVESVIDRVAELIKESRIREIADMRDETDLSGLKLTIDLKRGTDPEKLMQKLFRLTPLESPLPCNFNILIAGTPRVLGVREILEEWVAWRTECVRRRVYFDMTKKKEKLHLLSGLEKILLDIDRAIRIIRETDEEADVVPNLMIGFGIDETQAEFVAEIKLRNINRAYILKRTEELESLRAEIADLEQTVSDSARIRAIIIDELQHVKEVYGVPRRTEIVTDFTDDVEEEEAPESYPVTVFVSREGYLKKITPQSLRMSGEQKYKEGDGPLAEWQAGSSDEILVFSDRQYCYKTRLSAFEDGKASQLGDFLPTALGMENGENFVWACAPGRYTGSLLFFYENGKVARIALSAYQTQSNRRRLTGAYSDKSPLAAVLKLEEETEIAVRSTEGRCLIFSSSFLAPKTSRAAQGVNVMKLKPKYRLETAAPLAETTIVNKSRYRVRAIPAAGALLREEDRGEEQMRLGEI